MYSGAYGFLREMTEDVGCGFCMTVVQFLLDLKELGLKILSWEGVGVPYRILQQPPM